MSYNSKASQKLNHSQSRQPLGDHNQNLRSVSDVTDDSTSSRRSWLKRSLTFGRSTFLEKPAESSKLCPINLSISVAACPGSSVSTILAQVCGGPLSAVRQIQEQPYPILNLCFAKETHMRYFKYYVQRRRCIVNGIPLVQCEPTFQNPEDLMALAVVNESGEIPNLARRSLEISFPIPIESKNLHLTHCEISPSYVKTVFNRIGQVLQVRPMFRPNSVSYVVDFATVASAVKAKQAFEDELKIDRSVRRQHREFNKFAGFHGWSLGFLQDPTEFTYFF